MEKMGWDQLHVECTTSDAYSDMIKAYANGFLEGCLTYEKIFFNFVNLNKITWQDTNGTMPQYLSDYFTAQNNFTYSLFQEQIIGHNVDPYYVQVATMWYQMKGMVEGYNYIIKQVPNANDFVAITYEEWQVMTSAGDIFDLEMMEHSNRPDFDKMSEAEMDKFIMDHSHCSALFKVSPDLSDIFFAHNSWAEYGRGLRILKEYKFPYTSSKAETIIMSSYPGFVSSFDDFYVTSADMAVIETTNNIFNMKLYDLLTPKSLLYWQRVMMANRMAEDGETWAEVFGKLNGGTYNNMWMVLDMKKFEEGKILNEGAFTVLEQAPGTCVHSDQTDAIAKGYWPSYNIPFHHDMYKLAGWEDMIKKHPEKYYWYSYQSCPRANIFRRDQHTVTDIEGMQKIIRYNDYKNDPFTIDHNPSLSISSRYDLRDEHAACDGAYDAKISSVKYWKEKKGLWAIAGPTHDYVDYIHPFVFSKSEEVCPPEIYVHKGIPDEMNFPWMEFNTHDM